MSIEDRLDKILDVYPHIKKKNTRDMYQGKITQLLNELLIGVNNGAYQIETFNFYLDYVNELVMKNYVEKHKGEWN